MSQELQDRILRAVKEGRAARSSYYSAIRLEDEQQLGPPAPDRRLNELETRLKASLPPSYRMFLKLHDGWKMAFGAVDLLPVGEILVGDRADKIKKWQERQKSVGDAVAANGLVIGFGEATSIKILLDPNSKNDSGEWMVIGHDNGAEWTAPSFIEWLEGTVQEFRELSQEETTGENEEDGVIP